MNYLLKINGIAVLLCCLFQIACSDTQSSNSSSIKGVSTSGYPYEHIVRNEGVKPVIGDKVEYHEIVFKNDSLVRSTYLNLEPVKAVMPERDKVASPPPPSYDAIFLMSTGDSLITYHTLDTFKNYQLPGWLNQKDTLYYHLKLLSIQPKAEIEKEKADLIAKKDQIVTSTKAFLLDYQNGKLNSQLSQTESGIKYVIHEEGTGTQAENGKIVKVNYAGFLLNGDLFDNSYSKGRPFPFHIGRGRVIDGWDEVVPLLKEGGSGTFVIPYQLAYGEAGRPPSIPERSDLAFYIELLEVN